MSNAQAGATTSFIGFGKAVKGLGASLKALAVAHPILAAITIAVTAFTGISKIVALCTTSLEEQKEAFENAQNEYNDACSTLDDLKQKL